MYDVNGDGMINITLTARGYNEKDFRKKAAVPVQMAEAMQSEKPVPMIMLQHGSSLAGAGTATLTDPETLAEADTRISEQDGVFAAICGMYPEAELRCRLTTLLLFGLYYTIFAPEGKTLIILRIRCTDCGD